MSALLMGRCFYTDLPTHLRFTLVALADHANEDGESIFIGQRGLARKLGCGVRTVGSNLRELRSLGYIEKVGRAGVRGTDLYRLILGRLPTTDEIARIREEERRPADLAEWQPTSGADRQPTSTEPSVEPSVPSVDTSSEAEVDSRPTRPRDPMWDALVELYGPPTEFGRSLRGKVKRSLEKAGVTPELVREFVAKAQSDQREWVRSLVVTETSLAKNWPTVVREASGSNTAYERRMEEIRRAEP